MTLEEKLLQIQMELVAPKNQWNEFGKYKYRSCEDILEGLKPCLAKVKAAVTISDDLILIGDRYYVKATAILHDAESQFTIQNSAYAREELTKKGMDSAQVTGSTSSYARKYALNGLFGIDDVKDPDTRNNNEDGKRKPAEPKRQQQKQLQAPQQQKTTPKIDDTKARMLVDLCMTDGVDIRAVLAMYNVQMVDDLTEKKFQNIQEHWEDIKNAIFSR